MDILISTEHDNLHLNERNVISVVLRLLKLNIQLIFVADGPNKPSEKHGGKGAGIWAFKNDILHRCLRLLGVKWHNAPGEAEAECAMLQRRGLVDCVWTEDGDALMFGCGVLVRFFSKVEEGEDGEERTGKGKERGSGRKAKNGMKDLDKVVVYRAIVIQTKHPGFDREGLVFFAMLSGGDYGKGLLNCGADKASKVVEMGYGRELYKAMSASSHLSVWRKNLRKYFVSSGTGVSVPEIFPNKRIMGLYNEPSVSPVESLEKLEENVWCLKIDERELQTFLSREFDWGIDKYIELVVPVILTRFLASFEDNGKPSMDEYHLIYMENGSKCNAWYNLYAVTSLDKDWVDRCIEDLNEKRSKRTWKRYELPWGTEPLVEGRDLLKYLIKHVMEPVSIKPDSEEPSFNGRRRSLSPQRPVFEHQMQANKSGVLLSPLTPQDQFAVTKDDISSDDGMFEELDDETTGKLLETFEESRSISPSILLDEEETSHDHDASAEMALESLDTSKISLSLSPSSPFTITKEEYSSTFNIAMDAPLDFDSDTESLDASFSISRISRPSPALLPLDLLPSNVTAHSHLEPNFNIVSHLNPDFNHNTRSNTTHSLPLYPKTTNTKISGFEIENDVFAIAMDEPLDLDSDTDPLDAGFPISSITNPHSTNDPASHYQSQSTTHSPFPSNLEQSSAPLLLGQFTDSKEESTNENEADDEFSATDKDFNNSSTLTNSLALQDTRIHNTSETMFSCTTADQDSNQNQNTILYPAHPTGPYQELDTSSFFSSQSLSLSLSQFVSSQPALSRYQGLPSRHNGCGDAGIREDGQKQAELYGGSEQESEKGMETKKEIPREMHMDMDMDLLGMDFSGFFSSGSSLGESPALSQMDVM